MANAATLASLSIAIAADTRGLRTALNGVRGQLLGFIPTAHMLGGRVGGALIGAIGQHVIAAKARGILDPARANVAVHQGNVARDKADVVAAQAQVEAAQRVLRNARTTTAKATARAALASARTDLGIARTMLATSTQGLEGAKQASQAAHVAFEGAAIGIGKIALASAAAVGVVTLLARGLVNLASAGASLGASGHNVEQVFGRASLAVVQAAEQQARAFGQSKSEYLAYAADVGRSLEKLGVSEANAADMTTELLAAVQRLAQSKRISFGEAFKETQTPGALFTNEQLIAYAVEKEVLQNRNMMLNEGAEAILRNQKAIEVINATTDEAAQSGGNWNSQISMLMGNLTNLAGTIGTELEPTFVAFFKKINDLIQGAIKKWDEWKWIVKATISPLAWVLGIEGAAPEDAKAPAKPEDPDAVSKRNAAAIEKAKKAQAAGEAFGGGGRGGGAGGFQGGLVEFSRRVQANAFNQTQIKNQERQLALLQAILDATRAMKGNPGATVIGAGGGAAAVFGAAW